MLIKNKFYCFIYLFFIIIGLLNFIIQRILFENEIFTFFRMFIYTINLISTFGLYIIFCDYYKEYKNGIKKENV